METNHKLALYVAYYLSRFNVQGYENLGYKTMNEAHKAIGEILNTNPHTIKNMRDQFDPLHNHRVGWYQAPLSPSRVRVVEAFQDLSEEEIRSIIRDILDGTIEKDQSEKQQLLSIITTDQDTSSNRGFVLRGPTGKKAEDFFINYFTEFQSPISGELIDKRDYGAGYDFEVIANGSKYYVEVKGLSEISGGILFTNKEWDKAREFKEKYFLVIVANLDAAPKVTIIPNPARIIKPEKKIYTTIQIQWQVGEKHVNKILKEIIP